MTGLLQDSHYYAAYAVYMLWHEPNLDHHPMVASSVIHTINVDKQGGIIFPITLLALPTA